MSSRETGNGFNWRLVLAIGTPIAIGIAAVSIYIYYSRKKRKEVSEDIDTSEDRKEVKNSAGSETQQPLEGVNEEETAALRWLMEKKAEANICFNKKEFQRAVELYTELIDECPPFDTLRNDLAKIYHNRAATYEKLQGEDCSLRIIEDCTRAIDIDPKYAKARVRRAKAHEVRDEVMLCLRDWTLVGVLQPQLIENDPAYLRLDQLVAKKGQEIAEEVMKTHKVLLPSKVHVEDFMNIFLDFEFYTDANLLDLYRENSGVEAVPTKPAAPQLSNSTPDENGLNATGDNTTADNADNSSDPSVSNSIETDTAGATNHTSADNGADDQELMRRLKTEPFWRVVYLLRNRQYSKVIEITSQAIDTGCKVFHPYALLVRSTFYIILCQYTEALQDTRVILSYQNISLQVRVGALLRIACVNEALGDFDDAINTFEEAQRIDPTNPSTFLVRSKFYASDDRPDLDKAHADINKCLELKPDHNIAGRCLHALLKFKLASSSQSAMDMEKVKRHVREIMNQFPERPEPIAIYAQVLMEIQELHEASQYLEKAIEMDPDNGMLYVYRSQCKLYIRGVNTQGLGVVNSPHMVEATNDALEQLEYAIKIDPQCAIAMETIATICSQTGDTARALEYLDKAIKYVRTKQEMGSLQTLKLILLFQPEINKEMLACGLDPRTLQEYQFRQ